MDHDEAVFFAKELIFVLLLVVSFLILSRWP